MPRTRHARRLEDDGNAQREEKGAETKGFDPTSVPILHPQVIDALLEAFYGEFGKRSRTGTSS